MGANIKSLFKTDFSVMNEKIRYLEDAVMELRSLSMRLLSETESLREDLKSMETRIMAKPKRGRPPKAKP